MLLILINNDSLTTIWFKSSWKLEGNPEAKEIQSPPPEKEGKWMRYLDAVGY